MVDTNRHNNRIFRQLIHYFRKQLHDSPEQKDVVWEQILKKSEQRKKALYRKRLYWFSASAAAILGGILFWIVSSESLSDRGVLHQLAALTPIEEAKEIRLLVAQKEQVILPEDTILSYSREDVVVTTDIVPDETEESQSDEHLFDQVIVPRGKRMQLVLSDNSRMWVNSGTRVIYPRVFTGMKREIYTDGEIYLEVAPDKERPFIVHTNSFEVEVLGTSFNVCAYKEFSQSVVLVEGSVNIRHSEEKKSALLKPGQYLPVYAESLGAPEPVNTDDYVSWTRNLLVLRKEPLKTVFRKLHLYYGTEFVLQEPIGDITISGKLDLQEDIIEIVRSIASTAPIRYSVDGERMIIQSK